MPVISTNGGHVLHDAEAPHDTAGDPESPSKPGHANATTAPDHGPPTSLPAQEPDRQPEPSPGRPLRRAQMLIALAVMLAGDNMPPLLDGESEGGHG